MQLKYNYRTTFYLSGKISKMQTYRFQVSRTGGINWGTGIRTPIKWSRAIRPAVRRSPRKSKIKIEKFKTLSRKYRFRNYVPSLLCIKFTAFSNLLTTSSFPKSSTISNKDGPKDIPVIARRRG